MILSDCHVVMSHRSNMILSDSHVVLSHRSDMILSDSHVFMSHRSNMILSDSHVVLSDRSAMFRTRTLHRRLTELEAACRSRSSSVGGDTDGGTSLFELDNKDMDRVLSASIKSVKTIASGIV